MGIHLTTYFMFLTAITVSWIKEWLFFSASYAGREIFRPVILFLPVYPHGTIRIFKHRGLPPVYAIGFSGVRGYYLGHFRVSGTGAFRRDFGVFALCFCFIGVIVAIGHPALTLAIKAVFTKGAAQVQHPAVAADAADFYVFIVSFLTSQVCKRYIGNKTDRVHG